MDQFKKPLKAAGFAALIALAPNVFSQDPTPTVIMEDDFESYTTVNWYDPIGTWASRTYLFSDLGCQSVFTDYPVSPPFDQAAAPAVDRWIEGADERYNISGLVAGFEDAIDGTSLAIADAGGFTDGDVIKCHDVQVFREVATGGLGDTSVGEDNTVTYKVDVDYKGPFYSTPSSSAEVGMFLGVVSVSAGPSYNLEFVEKVPVDATTTTQSLSEEFSVNLLGKSNVIVQVGFYAQVDTDDGGDSAGAAQAQWDNLVVSWVQDEDEAARVENEACNDTSTIRFDEDFGGAEATCLTDTYEWPEDAGDFGGFADGVRDESLYPFAFQRGGQITFDCTSNSATETQRIRFKFENAPFPNNTPEFFTEWVECPTEGGVLTRLSEVRVADHTGALSVDIPNRPWTERYDNFLMFLETQGGPSVTVTNVHVTSNYNRQDGPQATPDAEPIPVLPLGGLLGLITLLGYMGYRRR